MADGAWISCAMIDERLYNLLIVTDIAERDPERAGDAIWRNNTGEPLSADWFPSVAWRSEDSDRDIAQVPDLFPAGGYWAVSAATAEVIQGFDLGQGALYPLQVLRRDRKTPMPGGEFFSLNFGNVKRAFRGDESKATPSGYDEGVWKPPFPAAKDNDIAVAGEALGGPDIWVDPALVRAFFLSGRLGNALKAAGVHRPFGLRKCRVLDAG